MKILLLLLFAFIFYSCNNQDNNHITLKVDSTAKYKPVETSCSIKIQELLKEAIDKDSIEFQSRVPFIFFKSGYFISEKTKKAIIITTATDSTYSLVLFHQIDKTWSVIDNISELEAFPVQFQPSFADYNFDKQNDIYIQVTVSNGYAVSRGHLIIVDPKTSKLELHKEARELGNIRPDKQSRSILSEEIIWCKSNGELKVCELINKWKASKLVTIKKECPCQPEE